MEDMETTDKQTSSIILPSCNKGHVSASTSCNLCKTPLQIPQFLHQNGSPIHNFTRQGRCHRISPQQMQFNRARYQKAFKSCNRLLRLKSVQNCEDVLELLNGFGLTTPVQIRKVTLSCPMLFCYRSVRIIESKFSFLGTFMKEEDIAKSIYRNARYITSSEDKLKSKVSLLRKLGLDGKAISKLVVNEPRFLMSSEKDLMESFKEAENLGIKKESKMFLYAFQATFGLGTENIDRRWLCFSNLGFSEKQIPEILRRQPMVLKLSEEKVMCNMNFLVNSVGLSLDDLVKHPFLFSCSMDKKLVPRYRVLEAMQMLKTKRTFPTIANWTEKRFLEEYVNSSAESSSVLRDIYHGGKAEETQECCEISSSTSI